MHALVYEIIGMIASSEGIVAITKDLFDRGVLTRTPIVPARAATFITPVCLRPRDLNRQQAYISNAITLVRGLQIDATSLTFPHVGLMEDLDFTGNQLFQDGDDLQEHSSTLHVTRAGVCHGFALFIVLASAETVPRRYMSSDIPTVKTWHGDNRWISTDASDQQYAGGWRNPVLLLQEFLEVHLNDLIVLKCQTKDATSISPTYVVNWSHVRAEDVIAGGEIKLMYSDLYPTWQRYV